MKSIRTSIFSALLLCLLSCSTIFAGEITVNLDGTPLALSAPAFIKDDRVLVPMRSILEPLHYSVFWDSENQLVTANNGTTHISLEIDHTLATVNQTPIVLDSPAIIVNGVTMLPLRFIVSHSGASIVWDDSTSTVSIFTDNQAVPSKKTIMDSTVYIQTNKKQGSGIILSSDGLIVTNYHVIEGCSTAQFVFNDGSIYQGETTIVALDPAQDIAILKIEKQDLFPAIIGTNLNIANGTPVVSIGSPSGKRNTMTTGVISRIDEDSISATTPVEQGSSGGGLFTTNGRLIGITFGINADTVSLSIPIASVMALPQNMTMPLNSMKEYTYTPPVPKNLHSYSDGTSSYISWSPIYNAEYYVYSAATPYEPFTRMKNNSYSQEIFYWGTPYSFAITSDRKELYIQVSAVINGVESEKSQVLKIQLH